MNHPPMMVNEVIRAVCILLGVEPLPAQTPEGKFEPSYWRAAIGDQLFGDPMLPDKMLNFDRSILTEDRMSEVEIIVSQDFYSEKAAESASRSLRGFFKWVQGIRDYYYLYSELAPRREALAKAEQDYKDLGD